MVRFKLIIFILLFSIAAPEASIQEYPNPEINSLLRKGIDKLILQKFEEAGHYFNQLKELFPKNPLGSIYSAANEIARAYDRGEEFNDELIMKNLARGIELAEELIEQDGDDIWNHYLLGLAEGHYAYYKALNGEWIPAFSYALACINDFETCMEIDSAFYEAYTAIGAYKYWKSKKTEIASWLPFFPDEKEKGIRMLEKSIKYTSYNTYLSVYTLQWIYIDSERYSDAIRISENALNKYPGSRFFLWGYARAYQGINRRKSIEIYSSLLSSYEAEGNAVQEITLKHIIAQQYEHLGENKIALSLCEEILKKNNLSKAEKIKLEDRLDRVKIMRESLK